MLQKVPRFILFKKENGEIIDMLPPCFEDEIEGHQRLYFNEIEGTEVLEEKLFSEIYYAEYISAKRTYWTDHAVALIESLAGLEVDVDINDEENSVESEGTFVLSLSEDKTELQFWFEVNCDILIATLLVLELTIYFKDLFIIEIKGVYFISKDKKVYTNEEVYFKQLKENINQN